MVQWLTPAIAGWAAALTLPVLLLLYFLKLKRQEQVVSSTFFWKRAVQDLQVNAPFQRLRRHWLLFLQLLALLLILAALGGPVLSLTRPPAQRTVLLIDRSASMNAVEPFAGQRRSRLEQAIQEASDYTHALLERPWLSVTEATSQIMIVAFDESAKVMCTFSSDRRQLDAALAAIVPTDKGSSLQEALAVARAFAQAPGLETNNRSAELPAHLVLFSDGQIKDLADSSFGADEGEYFPIGQETENRGFIALQAQRDFDNPDEVHLFAVLANYSTEATTVDVQVSVDKQVMAVRSLALPAATTKEAEPRQPGTTALEMSLTCAHAGVLEVRQLQPDALAVDDVAHLVLERPRQLKLLLVTAGNPVLAAALSACRPERLVIQTPAAVTDAEEGTWIGGEDHDVVVLDNVTLPALPRGAFLVFGKPPVETGGKAENKVENLYAVDWRGQHPVLRDVDLTRLFVAEGWSLDLPLEARVLAEFRQGPALAVLQRDRRIFLLAAFDVLQSNWPFEPGFVMFCFNALDFLGRQGQGEGDTQQRPGMPLLLAGQAPGEAGQVLDPQGELHRVTIDATGTLRCPATERAGLYRVTPPEGEALWFAVNSLDRFESDIQPQERLAFAGGTVEATPSQGQRNNVAIWPWLVVLVLGLVCLEWMVYNSKVHIA